MPLERPAVVLLAQNPSDAEAPRNCIVNKHIKNALLAITILQSVVLLTPVILCALILYISLHSHLQHNFDSK